MPIIVQCSGCQKQLRLKDEHAGKTFKCPACGQSLTAIATTEKPPSRTDTSRNEHADTLSGPVRTEEGEEIHRGGSQDSEVARRRLPRVVGVLLFLVVVLIGLAFLSVVINAPSHDLIGVLFPDATPSGTVLVIAVAVVKGIVAVAVLGALRQVWVYLKICSEP